MIALFYYLELENTSRTAATTTTVARFIESEDFI